MSYDVFEKSKSEKKQQLSCRLPSQTITKLDELTQHFKKRQLMGTVYKSDVLIKMIDKFYFDEIERHKTNPLNLPSNK